jgi:hypothetical protein
MLCERRAVGLPGERSVANDQPADQADGGYRERKRPRDAQGRRATVPASPPVTATEHEDQQADVSLREVLRNECHGSIDAPGSTDHRRRHGHCAGVDGAGEGW